MSSPSRVDDGDGSIHSLFSDNDNDEQLENSQLSIASDKRSSREAPVDRGSAIAAAMDQLEASLTSLGNNTYDEETTDDYLDDDGSEEEKDLRNSDIFLKKDFEMDAENELEISDKKLSKQRKGAENVGNSSQVSASVSPTSTRRRRRRKSDNSLAKTDMVITDPGSEKEESPNTVNEFLTHEKQNEAISEEKALDKALDKTTRRRRRSSVESKRSNSKAPSQKSSRPRSRSKKPESLPRNELRNKSLHRSKNNAEEGRRGASKTPGGATDRSSSPNKKAMKNSSNRRHDASVSPRRKDNRTISPRRMHGSKSPNRQRRLEKGGSHRELTSKSKKLDRSNQSHIRRKEEHRKRDKRNIRRSRSNTDEMGASLGNVVSVQEDPIRRRRNRRTRGNGPDQNTSRMSASLSVFDFEPNDLSDILTVDTHRGPQDVVACVEDTKIYGISVEEANEMDENQKEKKRGVMAMIKKKLLIPSTKKGKSNKETERKAALRSNANTDEEAVAPISIPAIEGSEELTQMIDDTIANIYDDNNSGEESVTPFRHRSRSRRPSGNSQLGSLDMDLPIDPCTEAEDNDPHPKRNIIGAAAAARARELDLAENEDRENRRKQRKEAAKAAAAAAQEMRSKKMSGDDDDEEELPRRRKKRSEATAAAAAARARARRDGLRPERTTSQAAAAEAAARARIRARKKGISLTGDDSTIVNEEDEERRKQRRLRDGAILAATSKAKAKLQTRDMVRSVSSDAAEAATKRTPFSGQGMQDQRVFPDGLRRQLSGEERLPELRKVRKGARRKNPRRTTSDSSGHAYTRQKVYEASGDELDSEKQHKAEATIDDNKPRRVLPTELKRELTGERKAPLRRQRSREGENIMDESRQTSRRRKPQRLRSGGSKIVSHSDDSGGSIDSIDDKQPDINSAHSPSLSEQQNEQDHRPSALQFDPKRKNHLSLLPMGHNDGSLSITSGHTAPAALSTSRTSRDSGGAQSMLGATEFGGDYDEEDDLMFADLDSGPEMDGNKSSSSLMPGAVKWIRRKTKKATKKLLT